VQQTDPRSGGKNAVKQEVHSRNSPKPKEKKGNHCRREREAQGQGYKEEKTRLCGRSPELDYQIMMSWLGGISSPTKWGEVSSRQPLRN